MISLKLYPSYDQKEYIIDGANICGLELNSKKKPMINNLKLVISKLIEFGVSIEKIVVLCDASLRYHIDNLNEYNKLIRKGIIKETPAGIKADKFILNYSINHNNCLIISNDLFREYYKQLPDMFWIKKYRIGVLRIKKEILLVPMQELII